MFHILKFDLKKYSPEDIQQRFKQIAEILPEGDRLIALPYGIDWIYDYPIDAIKSLHDYIEEYINNYEKEIKEPF